MVLHPDGRWRKSSRCESFECVEVAAAGGGQVLVRAAVDGPVLRYPAAAWQAFCAAVKAGDYAAVEPGDYAATASDSRVHRVTTRSA
jgi:Domain of unknown function (DUF397)